MLSFHSKKKYIVFLLITKTDKMEINEILDDKFSQETRIGVESVTASQFAILFFCSLGLYAPWWMYKAWKFFKQKDNLDIMPVGRAIFAIFFMYDLLDKIQRYAQSNGYKESYSSGGLFGWFILTNIMSRLPDPLWLCSFLGIFSFFQPLKAYNYAIGHSDIFMLEKNKGFNSRQIVLIVLGLLFWVLIMIGLFVPIEEYGGETF